jgi:hypothetical protein
MQKKPKEQPRKKDKAEDDCDRASDTGRSYYYDDAHGYEDYDPAADDAEPNGQDSIRGIDGDPSPDALAESKNTKRASRDMSYEDRDPNVDRLQR